MSHLLTVAEIVAAHARLQPDKVAVRDSRRALTFAQWDERATRLANALANLGLVKGDRVALLAFNCVEWMELYVALARAGMIAVPINFRLVPAEIEYIATNCDARAFVAQRDFIERIEPIRGRLRVAPSCFIHFGSDETPAGWQAYETIISQASAAASSCAGCVCSSIQCCMVTACRSVGAHGAADSSEKCTRRLHAWGSMTTLQMRCSAP